MEFDYTQLPFVENNVSLDFPLVTIFGVSLCGFLDTDSARKQLELHHSDRTNPKLYYPEGIFDNYKLSAYLYCCSDIPKSYSITEFGMPMDKGYELPRFEATLVDSSLESFEMNSLTEHHFNIVKYSNGQVTYDDPIYTFEIHGIGKTSLTFSKKKLYDNIFSEEGISSELVDFRDLKLIDHSFLQGAYEQYIQSVLENRTEYPPGTRITTASFFSSSFR